MTLLIRANDITSDSRLLKYVAFLESNGIPYHILGWDRAGNNPQIDNATFFKKRSGYSIGGYKAVYYRILWMLFCFKFVCTHKYNVIHGCDLDSVFPAVIYKIFKPRTRIIFDVFDWFSDTLANQPRMIRRVFAVMEKLSVKKADHIIICEKERRAQIPYSGIDDKICVLPNIPSFGSVDFLSMDERYKFDNDKLTVSYVGGFYGGRFLNELLDLAEEGYINLLIAGFGNSEIELRCRILSDKDNIYYAGKVVYSAGLNIMYNSDIVYAMYCKTNPNHIYAAPNKYYESMFLAKPIISTSGTLVGNKIKANNTGYVIEESVEELKLLLLGLCREDLKEKGNCAGRLWRAQYCNYTQSFMNEVYKSLINHQ